MLGSVKHKSLAEIALRDLIYFGDRLNRTPPLYKSVPLRLRQHLTVLFGIL